MFGMAFPKRILCLFLARVFVAMLKISVMNFERGGELTLYFFYLGYIHASDIFTPFASPLGDGS
jgi:hypothetical protein